MVGDDARRTFGAVKNREQVLRPVSAPPTPLHQLFHHIQIPPQYLRGPLAPLLLGSAAACSYACYACTRQAFACNATASRRSRGRT
jgi:hypothetical protein